MKYGYLGKTEIAFEMAQPETQEKVHSCVSQGQLPGRTLVFVLLTAHMQSSYALGFPKMSPSSCVQVAEDIMRGPPTSSVQLQGLISGF